MKKVVSYVHILKMEICVPEFENNESVEINRNFKNCSFDLFLLNLPLKPSACGSHIRIYYNKPNCNQSYLLYFSLFNQSLHIHKKDKHILLNDYRKLMLFKILSDYGVLLKAKKKSCFLCC